MPWLPWSANTNKTAKNASPPKKAKKIKPVKPPKLLNSNGRLPEHGKLINAATKLHDPFNLLSLPAHLRTRILRLIVVELKEDARTTEDGEIVVTASDWTSCAQPGVARVCWDLRVEALPLFYCENKFLVEVQEYNIEAVLKWWKMVQGLREHGVVAQFSKEVDGVMVSELRTAITYREGEMPRYLGQEPAKMEVVSEPMEFMTSKKSKLLVDTKYYETTDPEATRGAGWVILRKIPEHESPDLTDEQEAYIKAYHAPSEAVAPWLAQVKQPARITIRTDGQPNWRNLQQWLELVHKKVVAPLGHDDIDGSEHAGTVKAIFDSVVRFRPYPLKIAMLSQNSWRAALVDRDARWDEIKVEDAVLGVKELGDEVEVHRPAGLLTMGEDVQDDEPQDVQAQQGLIEFPDEDHHDDLPFSTAPQQQLDDEYGSDVDEDTYTELVSSAIKGRTPTQTDRSSSSTPAGTPTPAPITLHQSTPNSGLDQERSSPESSNENLSNTDDSPVPKQAKKFGVATTPPKALPTVHTFSDRSRNAKTKGLSTLHDMMQDANDYASSAKKERRVKGKKRKDRDDSPFYHGDPDLLDEDAEGSTLRKNGGAALKRMKLGGLRGIGGYEPFGETVMREVRDEEGTMP